MSQPSHRKHLHRYGLIAILILILMAGLFYFYILPAAVEGVTGVLDPAVSTFDSTQLVSYIGLEIPDYASDFHGATYNFLQSRIISVRFRILPDNADEFLIALGFTLPLDAGFFPFHPNSATLTVNEWWQPEKAKQFVGGSFTKSETFYDVLVDTTDSDSYTIYLMVEQG